MLAADKERRSAIRAAFASFAAHPGVQALQQQCEDDHAVTADAAGARLLAHLGSTATPVAGHLTTIEDETDKRRDESRVSSGFGKNVSNWVGREKVYPTNVIHMATECSNRNHTPPASPRLRTRLSGRPACDAPGGAGWLLYPIY